MEKGLPKNWISDKLFNVVEPITTNVKKYSGEKEYYSTGSIGSTIVAEGEYNYEKKPSRANRDVKVNDVLQARMKATNKAFLIEPSFENAIFSTGFMQFRSYNGTVLPKFLYYYLNSQDFLDAKDQLSTGATQQAINDANAKKINFPLPPLPEQERIVAKLDALFAQHEKMKQSLEKIPRLLKDLRQQILTQAVKGKLTEDWRKGKGLGEWKKKRLEEISEKIGDGLHGTPKYTDNANYYFVNGNNFVNGVIQFKDSTRTVDLVEFKKHQKPLGENTVFLSINGTLGNVAFYNEEKIILGKSACYVNVKEELLTKHFLKIVFQSNNFMHYAEESATGTTIKNLGLKAIRNFELSLPLFEEQTEIVSRVESLFAKADAIEQCYQKLKEKIDQLPQSILHKAFRGELVPQLPTDGDARDLLKEIEALKKVVKTNKRQTKNQ